MPQIFGTAKFIRSAGRFRELPEPAGDEFALLGRSNVGKSSFINHACAQGDLARTSKRPGTTVCANVYKIDETLYWLDLPGYGYASARQNERERWSGLIHEVCEKRESLRGIIWLIDIRHIGVAMDREAYAWLQELDKPVLPVLAKADKVSRIVQKKQAAEFKREFGKMGDPVLFSALEHGSRKTFWDAFSAWRAALT